MKRLLLITILISYSIASFGVSLNYFYCCGKLKEVTWVAKTFDKNCKGNRKKGCCKNEVVTVKLKTDQKTAEHIDINFSAPLLPIQPYHYHFEYANVATSCKVISTYKRPPPLILPSRNTLYCVYRI